MKKWTWKEAFEDAIEGAKSGIPVYQTFAGYCYCEGKGTKRDFKKAKIWYARAETNGEIDAVFSSKLQEASICHSYYSGQ